MTEIPTTTQWNRNVPAMKPVKYSSFSFAQKNKPQSNALTGGMMLILSTGVHLAWSTWTAMFPTRLDTGQLFLYVLTLSIFHIGATVGGFIGIVLFNKFTKLKIYMVSCAIAIVANIFYIVWHDEYAALIVARLCLGLVHGAVFIPLICHAGENSIREMRGRVAGSIGTILAVSTLLLIIVKTVFLFIEDNFNERIVGGMSLSMAVFGLVLTPLFNMESVVYLLQRGQDQEALTIMIKLRSESSVNWSITNDFEELKRLVAAAPPPSMSIFSDGNLRPLLLVGGLRALNFLSNNIVSNMTMFIFITMLNMDSSNTILRSPKIFVVVRCISSIGMTLLGDTFGRRPVVAYAAGGGGAMLLLAAILVSAVSYLDAIVLIVLIAIAFACFGFGVDTVPHIVASEAFYLHKKAWSLAFIGCIEHALHIVSFILMFTISNANISLFYGFFYVQAILIIALAIIMFLTMPETRAMSLSQCQDEYRGGVHGGVTYSRENVNSRAEGITHVL